MLLPHELHQVVLADRVVVRGADRAQSAALGGRLFHSIGDVGERRTGDVDDLVRVRGVVATGLCVPQ